VLVNIAVPAAADAVAALPCDGVGLMRSEFLVLAGGRHPGAVLADEGPAAYVAFFETAIAAVATAFHPRPVTYRSLDLKSSEYAGFEGGERFERAEPNAMLGRRGTMRYLADPEPFRLELAALRKAIGSGCDNLRLLVPFVRTADELGRVRELVAAEGLLGLPGFEFWAMAEVPAFALEPEPFLSHVDGVSIGCNDLRQLVLGVDRDSAELAAVYGDHQPAVNRAMTRIVAAAAAAGRSTSVCGDQVSHDQRLLADLLAAGVDSVSVAPDSVLATRASIAALTAGEAPA